MTNYNLKAEAGHIYISPFGFISYSEDFYEACRSHGPQRPFSPVHYYLACHSIELSLKAYLLLKGITRKELRNTHKLGHNLEEILKTCKELEIDKILPITATHEGIIKELNKWYNLPRKGFEYFELPKNVENSSKELPEIGEVQQLAADLISGLKEPCKNEANKP